MEPFVTKDGREIPLRQVGRRYVQQIFEKHQMPDPPTYEVELVGGGKQTFPHQVTETESTLQSPEDHQVWAEYQVAVVETTSQRFGDLLEFLLCNCVDLEPDPIEEWSIDFAAWGLQQPDENDPVAVKTFWIDNELLPDPDDQAALVSRLYQMAGIIGEDDVAGFERFFRSAVERLAAG